MGLETWSRRSGGFHNLVAFSQVLSRDTPRDPAHVGQVAFAPVFGVLRPVVTAIEIANTDNDNNIRPSGQGISARPVGEFTLEVF